MLLGVFLIVWIYSLKQEKTASTEHQISNNQLSIHEYSQATKVEEFKSTFQEFRDYI